MDLPITSITAAILAVLITAMSLGVSLRRQKLQVAVGHGDDHDLNRRIRAHANAVEYLPLALLLLGGMELNGVDDAMIHGFGITLLVSRLLHAWGLSRHAGTSIGRFAGTGLTLLLMVAMAVFAIAGFIQQQAA